MRNVLMTGGDGLVGAHLLASLLRRADVQRVFVLSRDAQAPEADARRRLMDFVGAEGERISLLSGDVQRARFGLEEEAWREVGATVDEAFHCAETQSLAPGETTAAGNWIEFLKQHEHVRLGYLSSAFVAGRRRGLFTEFDLDCGQSFRNASERACFEAERELRASPVSSRVNVFRPSHIVGDSTSGRAFAFTGFYNVLSRLRRKGLKLLAADSAARLDVVPVDYVAGAMLSLSDEPSSAGSNFHLVAGWEKSTPLRDFVKMVTAYGRPKSARVRFLPPVLAGLGRGAEKRNGNSQGSKSRSTFDEYLTPCTVFDNYLAAGELEGRGIICPPFDSYVGPVLEYAEAHGWAPPPLRPTQVGAADAL
ncbi:MAG: SDR family oxidoreductase [Pyrinomonadaceae bacterium]